MDLPRSARRNTGGRADHRHGARERRQHSRRCQRLCDDGAAGSLGHEPEHRRWVVRAQRGFSAGRLVERSFSNGLFSGGVVAAGDASQPLAARNGICRRRAGRTIRPQLSDRREPVSRSRRSACASADQRRDDFLAGRRTRSSIRPACNTRTTSSRLRSDAGSTFADLATLGHDRVRTLGWHQALADARAGRRTEPAAAASISIGCAWSRTNPHSTGPSRGVAPARLTSTSTTTMRRRATPIRCWGCRFGRQWHKLFAQRGRPGSWGLLRRDSPDRDALATSPIRRASTGSTHLQRSR